MRRDKIEPKLKTSFYKKIYPIFTWLTCEICGKEFRREPGWETGWWETRARPHYRMGPDHICSSCIKTEGELRDYLEAKEKRRTPPKKD